VRDESVDVDSTAASSAAAAAAATTASSASGDGILSVWLDKVAASERASASAPQGAALEDTDETAPAHHSSQEISKLWSVTGSNLQNIDRNNHGQCSNAQIENCLVQTALDAPSKTYDPAADVFHAADTYDCLVSTIGCCGNVK
jgi:hypothetical protein